MIATSFRSLEEEGVEYLRIIGQVAVLYGAAGSGDTLTASD
ncbi:MAG: hypothetical protein ABSC03_16410 [Verrucomicrobiota bacterium]|jgi:hypothetical protein